MYYDRIITKESQNLISENGSLRWLFDFVTKYEYLDFLIGKNDNLQWISVYYGLSRILRIIPASNSYIKVVADKAYLEIAKENNLKIYGTYEKDKIINFSNDLLKLITLVLKNSRFNKYYNNKKEGYYQTMFSREYGLKANGSEAFVIIDKESVIGFENIEVKNLILNPLQEKYRKIYRELNRINPREYGIDLSKKSIGNELDFLAVNSNGDIFLIEFKHGNNTSGIYLSPIQIGLYYDIFSKYVNQHKKYFEDTIIQIVKQKKHIGLIPSNFQFSNKINKIIPVLVISKYNNKSTGIQKFKDVLKISRDKLMDSNFLSNIQIYSYDENGLKILNV